MYVRMTSPTERKRQVLGHCWVWPRLDSAMAGQQLKIKYEINKARIKKDPQEKSCLGLEIRFVINIT